MVAALFALDDLLACLAIEETRHGHFSGPNLEMPYYRIFGGQLLAQAIAIATREGVEKHVKSMHVTFPRPGDLREPVDYEVQPIQDGRTFATEWIVGRQGDQPIVTALVSLHVEEDEGFDHQREMPSVGQPEDAAPRELSMIPWEVRIVGGVDLAAEDVGPPRLEFWQRAGQLADGQALHQALLAHSTDLTLIGTTLRPHPDVSEAHSPDRIQTAVTTHTMWFHRPFRLDDWVLVSQESPTASGQRGFGTGHAFAKSGELVASFAQESMIRRV
jgi:acyl-CoA thioesterase-2